MSGQMSVKSDEKKTRTAFGNGFYRMLIPAIAPVSGLEEQIPGLRYDQFSLPMLLLENIMGYNARVRKTVLLYLYIIICSH